jgi:hypothetical protein
MQNVYFLDGGGGGVGGCVKKVNRYDTILIYQTKVSKTVLKNSEQIISRKFKIYVIVYNYLILI